jgi:hypothetical protein
MTDRQIKLSTTAWVLAALIGLIMLLSVVRIWHSDDVRAVIENGFEWNDFHSLSLEKKIARANLIVIAKFKDNGQAIDCVVSEVLKKDPSVSKEMVPGDEISECTEKRKETGVNYGDGAVVFFGGTPTEFRYSATYFDGLVHSEGDVSIDAVRTMVHQTRSNS